MEDAAFHTSREIVRPVLKQALGKDDAWKT